MSFKENLNVLRELSSDTEATTMALEKITGKKLADYEGIDALVGALMGYYNAELKNKANSNHTHDARYYTEPEIDEKLKNFCPYRVGDIYLTTNSANPSSLFLGTTWQKIEDRFLLGTSGSGVSKQTGGSNSKILSIANIPAHTHPINTAAHTHSRGTMDITADGSTVGYQSQGVSGAYEKTGRIGSTTDGSVPLVNINFRGQKGWSGSTSPANPVTSVGNTGNGQAFDILPPYYTCHIWLRLT